MKRYVFAIAFFTVLFVGIDAIGQDTTEIIDTALTQVDSVGTVVDVPAEAPGVLAMLLAWLKTNWAEALTLVLTMWGIIARLTPSEKDNNLLRLVQSWIDAIIPNRKLGGGVFSAYKKPEDAPALGFVRKTEKSAQ